MRNRTFSELVRHMEETHDRKNSDYATDGNPYSNFEYAAGVAEGFTDPVDRVFATLIGVKLARLQQLTQPGRAPQNESLEDTWLDLATYATIWASARKDRSRPPRGPLLELLDKMP